MIQIRREYHDEYGPEYHECIQSYLKNSEIECVEQFDHDHKLISLYNSEFIMCDVFLSFNPEQYSSSSCEQFILKIQK